MGMWPRYGRGHGAMGTSTRPMPPFLLIHYGYDKGFAPAKLAIMSPDSCCAPIFLAQPVLLDSAIESRMD